METIEESAIKAEHNIENELKLNELNREFRCCDF